HVRLPRAKALEDELSLASRDGALDRTVIEGREARRCQRAERVDLGHHRSEEERLHEAIVAVERFELLRHRGILRRALAIVLDRHVVLALEERTQLLVVELPRKLELVMERRRERILAPRDVIPELADGNDLAERDPPPLLDQ